MSGSTNFIQVNPGAANQETDSTYASDPQRENGILTDAILASVILNKKDYQYSTFIAALALALSSKGYNVLDGSPSQDPGLVSPSTAVTALAAIFANILTNADLNGFFSTGTNGYLKLPTFFGGFTIQWVAGSSIPANVGGDPYTETVTFPVEFATACLFAIVTTQIASTSNHVDGVWQTVGSPTRTGQLVTWQLIGLVDSTETTPMVIAIGH
jgi:hypothetical protein